LAEPREAFAASWQVTRLLSWSSGPCVCSHCLRYDEYLNALREHHPEMALLAVASRQQETPDELRRAARERKLTFPILIDPGGRLANNGSPSRRRERF